MARLRYRQVTISMRTRREFFGGAAAVIATSARPVLGANDRVRVGVIGNGHRGTYVMRGFMAYPDCQVAALCDVNQAKMESAQKVVGATVDKYGDYRRVLERKDIDAVLVATPDHWHGPIMIQACEAGKDVYVEKPLSNSLQVALEMVTAARKHNRVVQVGLQQRSIDYFATCRQMIQDGLLGKITHAAIIHPGAWGTDKVDPKATPPGLDWDLFQGSAPKQPYSDHRYNNWRSYYDYGGGHVSDWGVHWTDIVHWYLNDDKPRTASAASQYVRYHATDQVPDVFSLAWQYRDFVMTFVNYEMPATTERQTPGVYFFGERGSLTVNRQGYIATPKRNARRDGTVTYAFEAKTHTPPAELIPLNAEAKAHVANFVDCMKTRQKPIVDIETGFQSTLPTLLGLMAIRYGKTYVWDGKKASAA